MTLPATLTLTWTAEEAFELGTLQLIFDTGLHRLCTFNIKEDEQSKQIWGQPQPEVLRDYSIEVLPLDSQSGESGGSSSAAAVWTEVVAVNGNYQRRVVHSLQMAGTKIVGLRVVCTRAAEIDEARICEVRAYPVGEDGLFPDKAEAVSFERARITRYSAAVASDSESQLDPSDGLALAALRAMDGGDPWQGPGRLPPPEESPEVLRLALPTQGKMFTDGGWKLAIGS